MRALRCASTTPAPYHARVIQKLIRKASAVVDDPGVPNDLIDVLLFEHEDRTLLAVGVLQDNGDRVCELIALAVQWQWQGARVFDLDDRPLAVVCLQACIDTAVDHGYQRLVAQVANDNIRPQRLVEGFDLQDVGPVDHVYSLFAVDLQ